jgi:quinoprotein glucose dehydrogenase
MRLNIARAYAPTLRAMATACAIATLGAGVLGAPQAEQRPTKSVWDGVYTEAQAKRGKVLYIQACATCHSGGDQAPALYGSDFLTSFDGQTVAALFDKVKQTMPQDKPGSLTPQETADVLAYVLSLSFPGGETDLDREIELLKQIRFEAVGRASRRVSASEK